jgi:carbon-monoxide dehydrogenase large subunit
MGAFRGAGRPEATQMLERAMDVAARQLGVDPVEIRRRNLLGADQFPFTTEMGTVYDSGDYVTSLDKAVELAGYEDMRAEQEARRRSGSRRQLGIGVATYVEITAGGGAHEWASVEVHPDGTATVGVGTSAHGQGHATAFAMIVADRLGLPFEAIRVVESDTAVIPEGGGTGGSRSLQIGGAAAQHAAGEVWDAARRLAAELLEASEDDVVIDDDGRIGVAGVPARALSWGDLATRAEERATPLLWAGDVAQHGETFPFGAHISLVEVDLDTGGVVPLRHVAVDDCGRIINPLIVTGQQHGGIAQGIAQALWEEVVFDADGNPLTANLADYGIPSAAELPSFESANTETPTPRNTLGAKGIGESGTIGATPSVQNAVVDALAHLGVTHIDMPCTSERVWQAILDAELGRVPPLWREPPPALSSLPRMGADSAPDVPDI